MIRKQLVNCIECGLEQTLTFIIPERRQETVVTIIEWQCNDCRAENEDCFVTVTDEKKGKEQCP